MNQLYHNIANDLNNSSSEIKILLLNESFIFPDTQIPGFDGVATTSNTTFAALRGLIKNAWSGLKTAWCQHFLTTVECFQLQEASCSFISQDNFQLPIRLLSQGFCSFVASTFHIQILSQSSISHPRGSIARTSMKKTKSFLSLCMAFTSLCNISR